MVKKLFTSESVTEGHPDKICDQISDAVLDALLEQDPASRCACEVTATTGLISVMGEISTTAHIDIAEIARGVLRDIGYTRAKYGFDCEACAVITSIDKQSADIALGVDRALEAKQGEMSDAEVEAVARAAGCDAFIRALENGYDTKVGGGGAHLSGGERQRIAIARAMLKNAPIVILDEATAYIDPENEAVIQRAVAKLVEDKTVIVIAHRLSTITDADRIFVIDGGRVAASGTHEQLLKDSELYREMWRAHIGAKDGDAA